jgi:hypothetical protein
MDTKKTKESSRGLAGKLNNFVGGLMPKEGDRATKIEKATEKLSGFFDIGENIFYGAAELAGMPSIRQMTDEMQSEMDAADITCDAVGGKSIEIPNAIGPNPKVCFSADLVLEAVKPENWAKTSQIAASCGLEEMVSDPVDFLISLKDIIQDDRYQDIPGWLTGALMGEGTPALNLVQLVTMPAQLSACIQAKVAREITGDLSEEEFEDITKKMYEFTGRDTGMADGLLKKVGL